MLDLELYQKKLNSLQKNLENVPHELLITKYAKPYGELREELKIMTIQLLREMVMPGIKIRREDVNAICDEINKVIQESGIIIQINRAVYVQPNFDTVLDLAWELKSIVMKRYQELIKGDSHYV